VLLPTARFSKELHCLCNNTVGGFLVSLFSILGHVTGAELIDPLWSVVWHFVNDIIGKVWVFDPLHSGDGKRNHEYRLASDKAIGSYSDVRSQKAADIAMFDNPVGFGDRSHGDVTSMIVFEFKRPGDVASNMPQNCLWEFSDLTDKYFDSFTYGRRKNSKGMAVNVRDETRKFAYIVLSDIPEVLEKYNTRRDWKPSPYGPVCSAPVITTILIYPRSWKISHSVLPSGTALISAQRSFRVRNRAS